MAEPPVPLAALSDAELERALIELGRQLVYPPTPDIAGRVRARIESEPAPPRAAPAFLPGRQRVWLAAAIVLLAIVAGLVLFPEARTAIADRLGLRGVSIQWLDEAPPRSPVGARLGLGRPVTLEEARAAAGFPVLIPTQEGFATPREIYLSGQGRDTMVSFVYPAAPGLPAADDSGVGALLTQFQGHPERNLVEKGLLDGDAGSMLEAVAVGEAMGFWISGAPHSVFFVCYGEADCRKERYRLASNVLLWEQDGLTMRLESGLSRDEALAIAASVRAAE